MITPSNFSSSASDPASGPYEYRRGWLVHSGDPSADLRSWTSIPLGTQRSLTFHPAANVTSYSTGDIQVVLIGLPVDLDNQTHDKSSIAKHLAALIENGSATADSTLNYVSYLGGRFVSLMQNWKSGELVMVTDCAATLPIYWSDSGQAGFVASPHASLCAKISKTSTDSSAAGLIKIARELKTPGTLFPPGTMTGYDKVLQVLPNHYLRVHDAPPEHKRYYPFPDTALEPRSHLAFEEFSEAFALHSRLLSELGPVGISLTGGRDSRATLAAATPYLNQSAITWTYFNSSNPHPEHLADMKEASRLARIAGIRHIEVDMGAAGDEDFDRACRRTMGATAQMVRVPIAYNSQLPADIVEFQSMAAEIGTGFYKNRFGRADLGRLTQLYTRGKFAENPLVRTEIERFMDYADFNESKFGPIDFHDLFYWEHRLGRWGSRRIQEVDLAHTVVLPFNARKIVESLMAKPIEERYDKVDLVRFVDNSMPGLSG